MLFCLLLGLVTLTVSQSDASRRIVLASARSQGNTQFDNAIRIPATQLPRELGLSEGTTVSVCLAAAGVCPAIAGCTSNGAVTNGEVVVSALPAAWSANEREHDEQPRQLCITTGGAAPILSGFNLVTEYNCRTDADCTSSAPEVAGQPAGFLDPAGPVSTLNAAQLNVLASRRVCCNPSGANSRFVGTCINPAISGCCGHAAYPLHHNKCCNPNIGAGAIAGKDENCRCTTAADCPGDEPGCCLPTKYPEFANLPISLLPGQLGRCFNPARHQCCDTGRLYDPGSEQCCAISGVQSLNSPCPCETDLHCREPSGAGRCCRQTEPPLRSVENFALESNPPACSAYSNYPSTNRLPTGGRFLESHPEFGQNNNFVHRCTGTCININFQICCNGNACAREFERCCNTTCCNKFIGSCKEGIRTGTPGNAANYLELNIKYDRCSTVEQIGVIKAFFVFVLPVCLLAATVLSLALVLIYANKTTARAYSFLERSLMVLSTFLILVACTLFFSPVYKYGVIVVLVGLITFMTGAIRLKWLNVFNVLTIILVLLYLFDPFNGNFFLNFATGPGYDMAGVLQATGRLTQPPMLDARPALAASCTEYYNYFTLDTGLLDVDRIDNPEIQTFGYCGRGWIVSLLVFEALLLILGLVLFVLSMMALVRFRKDF